MELLYSIAGLITKFTCSGRTFQRAEAYRIENATHVDVEIPDERIVKTCNSWKADNPQIDDDTLLYLATGALFYEYLLNYDGMMLHASAVVVDDKAYLFSASPGTGKSTHTQLWLKKFGNRAYILNDDKPALRLIDGKWYACGTPWSGKDDISVNKTVELAGIAMVHRADTNAIEIYSGFPAIFDLFSQINTTKHPQHREKVMYLLDKLLEQIPIWKLSCNMELQAADVAYKAMSKGE